MKMAVLLFSLSFLFITQRNQQNLIHALQTGTFQQRESALKQILQIPPAERTEQLWLALADKLASESRLEHQKVEDIDAAVRAGTAPVSDEKAEGGGGYSEYLHELAEAVGQWHDTRALPALVDAAGLVDSNVIFQFGDQAVAPLIAGARQGHFSEQSIVLYELQTLLEGQDVITPAGVPRPGPRIAPAQLSAQSRQQIRDLARDLLKPRALKMPEVTLHQVSNLALATGGADLRQQVQALADLRSELSNTTGITDANKLVQVQNLIRAALADHKQ
jgi:hypothetical protein